MLQRGANLDGGEPREQGRDLHAAIIYHALERARAEARLAEGHWRGDRRAAVAQTIEEDIEQVGGRVGARGGRVRVGVGRGREHHLSTELAAANALDILEQRLRADADAAVGRGELRRDLSLHRVAHVANGCSHPTPLTLRNHLIDNELARDRIEHARIRHVAHEQLAARRAARRLLDGRGLRCLAGGGDARGEL